MAWELRGQKRYYYRSRRCGGRVIKEYFGAGPEAHQAAEEDAQRRARRAADRQTERQRQIELQVITEALTGLGETCEQVMQATLIGRGHHQHHGQWRKRRERKEATQQPDQ